MGRREPEALGWHRVPKWDSEYVSVWDNPDGHRYIAIRGTDFGRMQDVEHDVNIARSGTTVDMVGGYLQGILDDTEPSRIVDVGAHSLGTVLVLEAYKNRPDLQNRVHITRLYNPAYNPQLLAASQMPSVSKDFEQDPRVRYFINLGDVVSMGGFGTAGPKNVVYRTPLGNDMAWSSTGGGGFLGGRGFSQACPYPCSGNFSCVQRGGYLDGRIGRYGGRGSMAICLSHWSHPRPVGGLGACFRQGARGLEEGGAGR